MHRVGVTCNPRGQAIIELAVALPLLILLLMGVYDFSRALHAQSIITNMSREGANLIARANMNLSGDEPTDFQNVLDLVGKTAQPLDMVHHGMMYIYKVERINNRNTITDELAWNRSAASPKPSRNPSARNLGGITLSPGQTAYGVEVYYQYRSLFFGSRFAPTLQSVSIF
jgi:hypothetical protein